MSKIDKSFPSNNHSSRKKAKNLSKVTSGKVVKKKKSLGNKFAETFFGDNIEGVSSYVLYDVIIPAAKNMISDTVTNGIEMALFGKTKGSRTRRDRGKSYVSYSSYSRDPRRSTSRPNERDRNSRNRASHNFDDIILESRGEAEEVLSCLVDLTDEYGMASVADMYDLVGITSNFTDNKYGWFDLGRASVSRVREGYLISLPRTEVID